MVPLLEVGRGEQLANSNLTSTSLFVEKGVHCAQVPVVNRIVDEIDVYESEFNKNYKKYKVE